MHGANAVVPFGCQSIATMIRSHDSIAGSWLFCKTIYYENNVLARLQVDTGGKRKKHIALREHMNV